MDETGDRIMNCDEAQRTTHRVLDGDLMDATSLRRHRKHIESCLNCAGFDAELNDVQQALQGLTVEALPDQALDELLAQTSRAERVGPWRRWGLDWRALAAAAVLAFALVAALDRGGPVPAPQPTPAELAQASEDARRVLALTAKALRRTEEAVVGEVVPALSSIPIRLSPSTESSQKGRNDV